MAFPSRWIAWGNVLGAGGSLKQKVILHEPSKTAGVSGIAPFPPLLPMLKCVASKPGIASKASNNERRHRHAWRRWFFRSQAAALRICIAVKCGPAQCLPMPPGLKIWATVILFAQTPPAILRCIAFFHWDFQYEHKGVWRDLLGSCMKGNLAAPSFLETKLVILRSSPDLSKTKSNRISNGRGAIGKCTKRFFLSKKPLPLVFYRNPVVLPFLISGAVAKATNGNPE